MNKHSEIADSPLSASELASQAKQNFLDSPWLGRVLQQWRPYICPFERLVPHVPFNASVLDVGCGRGLLLMILSTAGRCRYGVGIDVSQEAIQSGKAMASRLAQQHPATSLDFRVIVPARIEWPVEEFDVVALVDVIHHIPVSQQRPFFLKAIERLRPGGRLLYKDMCRRPVWRAWANRMHDLTLARQWIHYAPIAEIEQWAAEAGLSLLHREEMTRLWYGHELRVFGR